MAADIITIGMLVTDMITGPVTPAFFERDSMHVRITTLPGGDACNVAVNAAAMGMRTALVSCVGDDPNGIFLKDWLGRTDVDLTGLWTADTTHGGNGTAVSLVMVEPSGERHFLTSTDIFADISGELVTDEMLCGAKFLSLNSYYRMQQLEGEKCAALFRRAHAAGAKTVMDTMPCREGDPLTRIRPALRETDIFMPSYDEAKQITGEKEPERIAELFLKEGPEIVAVKLGAEGSYVTNGREAYFVPAAKVSGAVSTVGAGDSYCAGFMTAMAHGYDLRDSAVFAGAAASFTVSVTGAVGGIRSYEEVEERFEEERRRILGGNIL